MAKEGDIVIAEITAVILRKASQATSSGISMYSPGYVTVKCSWGYMTLVDGSVQGIPLEHHTVGKLIKLRWGTAGGYHGPMFAGLSNKEEE